MNDNIMEDFLTKMMHEKMMINRRAKKKIGDKIVLTSNWALLTNCLIPTYTDQEARRIAQRLCGQSLKIISIDMLTDNGNQELYYSLEDNNGRMWVFPERLCD